MFRIVFGLLLAAQLFAADMRQLVSAAVVNVTNSSATQILCPLASATTIQVYIRPSSTAQIFTITNVDGSTIEVPSGGSFTMKLSRNLDGQQVVFSVTTASSTAVLQVIGVREVLQ